MFHSASVLHVFTSEGSSSLIKPAALQLIEVAHCISVGHTNRLLRGEGAGPGWIYLIISS